MKTYLVLLVIGVMYTCIMNEVATLESCYPSKFGPADEIGNLNYLTAEKTLQASKLIKTGKSYRLGIETNKNTPAFPPRTWAIKVVQPGQDNGTTLGITKTTYNDDIINGWVGVGTQIDGLGHLGIDGFYYNCANKADFVTEEGLTRFGIQNLPPIVTRAVILDMVGYFGQDPVREGTQFNRREIQGAMRRQNISSIDTGDVVLFYTGWTKLIGVDNARYNAGEPGLGVRGARYLASRRVVAVGSDSWGVEVIPGPSKFGTFEAHQVLLTINGIYILENINTEQLVKDNISEGFFTLGVSRITGGVQAIINPIIIV